MIDITNVTEPLQAMEHLGRVIILPWPFTLTVGGYEAIARRRTASLMNLTVITAIMPITNSIVKRWRHIAYNTQNQLCKAHKYTEVYIPMSLILVSYQVYAIVIGHGMYSYQP